MKGTRGGPSQSWGLLRRHGPLLAVAVVLAGTMDDRFADRPSDSWQILKTAVAIAETGEIGMAAGPQAPRALFRKEGDAVSRYGMGMSFAQVPASFAAPWVEKALGPGRSGPLFLLAPFCLALLAAWLSGRAARLLGAGDRGASLAILLTGLGSPLGSYAAWSFSETLQAAALAGAFAAALWAARSASPRAELGLALAAGLAAGTAILTKSSLLAAAPLCLLPLVVRKEGGGIGRRLAAAVVGAAVPLGAWLAFEIVRFGSPLTSYGGEGFTHPLLDGLWRLVVGPNKGLVLYFPAFVVALAVVVRSLRAAAPPRQGDPRSLAAASALLVFGSLLGTSAAWWSWHGMGGWGPRLLVPAVPILAAFAALGLEGRLRLSRLVVAVSVLLNLPPLLVHPSLVETYMGNMQPVPLGAGERKEWPDLGLETGPGGEAMAPPIDVLATVPTASGHVVYPWFFTLGFERDLSPLCRRLEAPPWISSRPDLGPRLIPVPPEIAREFVRPARWNFLGRSFLEEPERSPHRNGGIYLEALADQVRRAHRTGRLERGLALAEKRSELARAGVDDPLVAESLRLLHRHEALLDLLARCGPLGNRVNPDTLVVAALLARDRGDEGAARKLLAWAASTGAFAGTPVERDLSAPLAEWPPDLSSMTSASTAPPEKLRPALPSFRSGP